MTSEQNRGLDDRAGRADLFFMTVILTDDNVVNRNMLSHMLRALGCKVITASNGHEAVSRSQQGGHDIVLMDCQMPEMNGYEAARAIRRNEKKLGTQRTPIIAMTANTMEEDRRAAAEAGMDDFLAKPFRLVDLQQMLSRWQAGFPDDPRPLSRQ